MVSSRYAFYCLAGLMILAVVILETAYVRNDFHYSLVAQNSSTDTPTFYKLTAMWSSQAGSLLLWGFVLSIFSSLVLHLTRGARTARWRPTPPACWRASPPSSSR